VSVSALERRYGVSSLTHRAGLKPRCSWQLWLTPATATPLRFYITPHFAKCRAVVGLGRKDRLDAVFSFTPPAWEVDNIPYFGAYAAIEPIFGWQVNLSLDKVAD
jgi:hypothetical protein